MEDDEDDDDEDDMDVCLSSDETIVGRQANSSRVKLDQENPFNRSGEWQWLEYERGMFLSNMNSRSCRSEQSQCQLLPWRVSSFKLTSGSTVSPEILVNSFKPKCNTWSASSELSAYESIIPSEQLVKSRNSSFEHSANELSLRCPSKLFAKDNFLKWGAFLKLSIGTVVR